MFVTTDLAQICYLYSVFLFAYVHRNLLLSSISKLKMTSSFPTKLWDILENEDQTIIHWHEDGNSFKIEDLPRFEREIIPKYFRRKHSTVANLAFKF